MVIHAGDDSLANPVGPPAVRTWPLELVSSLGMGVFAGLFFGALLGGIAESLFRHWRKENVELLQFTIFTLSFQGWGLLLVSKFLREQKLTWSATFGLESPGLGKCLFKAVWGGVVISVAALELGWICEQLIRAGGWTPQVQAPVQMLQSAGSPGRRFYYGLVAILLVPVAEEVLFRGIIFSFLKQITRPQVALWASSLLFALIHFNLMAFVPLVFVAVMLALLYEDTGNLLAPIMTHAVFNFTNFTLMMQEERVFNWFRWIYERV